MIECSEKNIWYKRRRKPLKRFFSFFLIILISSLTFYYYFKVVTNNIYEYSANYIYNFSTETLNEAILQSLNNSVQYDELVIIDKDSAGNIILITSNSIKFNQVARNVVAVAKKNLNNSLDKGVSIPFTSFLGLNYLSAYGRELNYKNLSVASVECDFVSNFSSGGINQTLHSIYIQINSKVFVNLPLYKKEINCSSKILVSESIIVGKVPDFYLKEDIFS